MVQLYKSVDTPNLRCAHHCVQKQKVSVNKNDTGQRYRPELDGEAHKARCSFWDLQGVYMKILGQIL